MARSRNGTNHFLILYLLFINDYRSVRRILHFGKMMGRARDDSQPEEHEEHERKVESPSDEEGGQTELVST